MELRYIDGSNNSYLWEDLDPRFQSVPADHTGPADREKKLDHFLNNLPSDKPMLVVFNLLEPRNSFLLDDHCDPYFNIAGVKWPQNVFVVIATDRYKSVVDFYTKDRNLPKNQFAGYSIKEFAGDVWSESALQTWADFIHDFEKNGFANFDLLNPSLTLVG